MPIARWTIAGAVSQLCRSPPYPSRVAADFRAPRTGELSVSPISTRLTGENCRKKSAASLLLPDRPPAGDKAGDLGAILAT